MQNSVSKVTGRTSPSSRTDSAPVVSVVVPVHNERENVPQLLEEIRSTFHSEEMALYRPYEALFVEDGSTDGTREWIAERAARSRDVVAVHLRRSWGQSAALAAGFDQARGDIVVPMDGDLQNDPRDIPRLINRLEDGHDCVSGNRTPRRDPWHKTIPSRIQTTLAKTTGPDINDFGCTLKAYRAQALNEIDLYGEGHRYLPAKLHKLGYDVTEIDVTHRPRKHGDSRYGASRLLRGFSDLVFHWFWNRYGSRPFHFFGGGGIAVMAAGAFLGVSLLAGNYAGGEQLAANIPSLLLSVAMVLFGALTTMFGVILEVLTKLYYRDETEYRVENVIR